MSPILNRKMSCNIMHLTGAMTRYLPSLNVDMLDREKSKKKKQYAKTPRPFGNMREIYYSDHYVAIL